MKLLINTKRNGERMSRETGKRRCETCQDPFYLLHLTQAMMRDWEIVAKVDSFCWCFWCGKEAETKEEEDDVNVHDLVLLQPFLPEEMAEKRYVTEEEEDEDEDEDEG